MEESRPGRIGDLGTGSRCWSGDCKRGFSASRCAERRGVKKEALNTEGEAQQSARVLDHRLRKMAGLGLVQGLAALMRFRKKGGEGPRGQKGEKVREKKNWAESVVKRRNVKMHRWGDSRTVCLVKRGSVIKTLVAGYHLDKERKDSEEAR